jgi:hypothetical protein
VLATCLALALRAYHLESASQVADASDHASARAPRLDAPARREVGA